MVSIYRLINKNKLTTYGITCLNKHNIIIDLQTGYINSTKLYTSIYICNKPKSLNKWLSINKNKIDNIRKHLCDEIIDNDIMYTKKTTCRIINDNVLKMCSYNKPITLYKYNKVNNTSHVNFNCLIKGTYVHPILLLKIYMSLNDIKSFNKDLLNWSITYMLLFKFNLLSLKYDFMVNDLLCDSVYTQHIHNNIHLYDIPKGHIPIVYNNHILSILIINNHIHLRYSDVINVMFIYNVPKKYIKSFKTIYDSIYYKDKHPLEVCDITESYVAYTSIKNKVSKEIHIYFNKLHNIVKNNTNKLYTKINNLHISDYVLPDNIDHISGMYVIYIGIHDNEHLFKYGITCNIHRRLSEHRRIFGKYILVNYIYTRKIHDIEKDFKNTLKLLNISRKCIINGKTHTELFTLTSKYNIHYILNNIRIISKRYANDIDDLRYINKLQRIIIDMYV